MSPSPAIEPGDIIYWPNPVEDANPVFQVSIVLRDVTEDEIANYVSAEFGELGSPPYVWTTGVSGGAVRGAGPGHLGVPGPVYPTSVSAIFGVVKAIADRDVITEWLAEWTP